MDWFRQFVESLGKLIELISSIVTRIGPTLAVLLLLLVLLLVVCAAALKWFSGELSQALRARREFGDATGNQVANVANRHYWAIANAAGTLNVGLAEYLEAVELRVYLLWDKIEDLRGEIDHLSQTAAKDTFHDLDRLLAALHDFQFSGSNTYLLVHQSSDRQLRRLYNLFRSAIPTALVEMMEASAAKGDRKLDVKPLANGEGSMGEASPNPQDLWKEWLRKDLPAVVEASDALRAFARLLQHELAWLHVDWYGDSRWLSRGRSGSTELSEVEKAVDKHEWPQILHEEDVHTLRLAQEEGDFFRSLGIRPMSAASGDGEERKRVVRDKAETGSRQSGDQKSRAEQDSKTKAEQEKDPVEAAVQATR